MEQAILSGLYGLVNSFLHLDWRSIVMIIIGLILLWLGIKKDCEPLLLVPIGFGCLLVNIPLADLMGNEGFLRTIYDMGISNELFPLLIFLEVICSEYRYHECHLWHFFDRVSKSRLKIMGHGSNGFCG